MQFSIRVLYLRDANTKMGNPIAEYMHFSCIRCIMKTYSEIYRDFCNTTRLRFKTFWYNLKYRAEERRRQEEEQLKRFTQSLLDKIFG